MFILDWTFLYGQTYLDQAGSVLENDVNQVISAKVIIMYQQ